MVDSITRGKVVPVNKSRVVSQDSGKKRRQKPGVLATDEPSESERSGKRLGNHIDEKC